MKTSTLSRLIAVVLVCLPLAWAISLSAQRNLDRIRTDPAVYLQHARSVQHPSFLYQFLLLLIFLGGLTFVIEGLAQLVDRLAGRQGEPS